MELSKDDARDLVYGDLPEGVEIFANEILGTSRWSICKRIVFRRDGVLYGLNYSVGATEYQEQEPFEYDDPKPYEVEVVMVPSYQRKNITLASQNELPAAQVL